MYWQKKKEKNLASATLPLLSFYLKVLMINILGKNNRKFSLEMFQPLSRKQWLQEIF